MRNVFSIDEFDIDSEGAIIQGDMTPEEVATIQRWLDPEEEKILTDAEAAIAEGNN